jgi:hypothetical protein
MRIAIFSDIHDNDAGLQAVLADAERRNADRLIFLGDLGNDERLFETLQRLGVDCLFGNWEVSGLQRLSLPVHDWVSGWPSTLQEESAIFCHATPDMPAQADTTQTPPRTRLRTCSRASVGNSSFLAYTVRSPHYGTRWPSWRRKMCRLRSMAIRTYKWRGGGASVHTGKTTSMVDAYSRGLA